MIPPEEFHLIKEGITKLLIFRLLESSKNAATKALLQRISTLFRSASACSETPRRTADISSAQMKGCELGLVAFVAFPVLVGVLDEHGESW